MPRPRGVPWPPADVASTTIPAPTRAGASVELIDHQGEAAIRSSRPDTTRPDTSRPGAAARLAILAILAVLAVVASLVLGGCGLSSADHSTPADAHETTGGALPTSGAVGSPPASETPGPPRDHIVIILMENHGPSVLGDPAAPWLAAAAARYRVATDYTALAHPSQPNYIALTSGGTQGVSNDGTVDLGVENIVDRLEATGKTWKAYMQSLPTGGNTPKLASSARTLYARKHDPFVSYTDVSSSDARMGNIVDLGQLATDAAAGALPDFAWISPDQCHDMHGIGTEASSPCPMPQTDRALVGAADSFLATWVPRILASPGWTDRSIIFVTWDEGADGDTSGCCGITKGGGHVALLAIMSGGPRTSSTPYNHYSLLTTISERLGLACLGVTCDTSTVKPMTDLVGP
ncbi:MAG TPA: alkaline phosphatase family protein [Candidatus Limnocylindrales bacterium]